MKKFFKKRTLVSLIVILFITVSAGIITILSLKKGAPKADTTTDSIRSTAIFVQLPKNLADYLKSGMSSTRTINTVYEQQIKDLTWTTVSATTTSANSIISRGPNTKEKFSDTVIVYKDQDGKIILPDPTKYAASITRSADQCPPTNNRVSVNFMTNSIGALNVPKLQQIVDQYYSQMVEVFGPPLFPISVDVYKEKPPNGMSGMYTYNPIYQGLMGAKIYIDPYFIDDPAGANDLPKLLIHEIGHAWLGYIWRVFPFDNESAVEAMAYLVTKPNLQPAMNYDYQNRAFLTFSYIRKNMSWYDMGGTALQKIYKEDRSFFKKWHCAIYAAYFYDPRWEFEGGAVGSSPPTTRITGEYTSDDLKRDVLSFLPATVENMPKDQWYDRQYIFYPFLPTGNTFITPTPYYALLAYQDYQRSDTISGSYTVNITDINNNNLIKTTTCDNPYFPACVSNARTVLRDYTGWATIKLNAPTLYIRDNYPAYIKTSLSDQSTGFQPMPPILSNSVPKTGQLIMTNMDNNTSQEYTLTNGVIPPNDSLPTNLSRYKFTYYCPAVGKSRSLATLGQKNASYPNYMIVNTPAPVTNKITSSFTSATTGSGGTFNISVARPSIVNVSIKSSTGTTIKTLQTNYYLTSSEQLVWDGKNNSGITVANGIYMLSVTALDGYCRTISSGTAFSKVR